MSYEGGWMPIATAPKDGTRILAAGKGYANLDAAAWDTREPKIPTMAIVRWVEDWYDEYIEQPDGSYRKERKKAYAYWSPHPHQFYPTHWQPLPSLPDES